MMYLILFACLFILVYFLYLIRKPLLELFYPVFIAFFLTYLANPLVNFFEEKYKSRTAAIIIVYVLAIAVIAGILLFLVPELVRSVKDLSRTIPVYFERYQLIFYEFVIRYKHSDLPARIKELLDENIAYLEKVLTDSLQIGVEAITGAFSFFVNLILGAVISFYILKDMDLLKKTVISLIPRKARKWTFALARDIDVVLSGFIRGQLLVAAILSILTALGLLLLRVRYALLLGVIVGMMDVIPYFGPILGIVPAIVIAFIDRPVSAVWVIVLYFIIQQLEGAVISPRIVGSRVGLHPVIIILAVMAGGKFFGLAGLLLAVPIAGIIKVLVHRIIDSIVS